MSDPLDTSRFARELRRRIEQFFRLSGQEHALTDDEKAVIEAAEELYDEQYDLSSSIIDELKEQLEGWEADA